MMDPKISTIPEPLPRKSCQMLAVAIWNVSEAPEHADLWSLRPAQNNRLLTPPPTKTQSQPQIAERQGPKSMGTALTSSVPAGDGPHIGNPI